MAGQIKKSKSSPQGSSSDVIVSSPTSLIESPNNEQNTDNTTSESTTLTLEPSSPSQSQQTNLS